MYQQPISASFARHRRSLSILAAVVVGGLLLGIYAWHIHTPPSPPHPVPKPTVSPSIPENVYTARNNHVVKLDGRTGAILWQYTLTPPSVNSPATCLQIVNGVLYAILDYDSYALLARDGTLLWHIRIPSTQTKNLSCQVVDNRLYILHRDGTYSAFNTKNGAELWRSAVVLTSSMLFDVQHGTIYSDQSGYPTTRLSALDTATGRERWHVDLQGGGISSPLVAKGMVYYTIGNKLYAFDEATGHQLWQQQTDNQAIYFSLASVVNGILYAQTDTVDLLVGGECQTQPPALVCQANTYHIYAFDAKKGTLLWKSDPGRQLYADSSNDLGQPDKPGLPLVNGLVIATAFQDPAHDLVMYALDARSGRVRWQSRQECYDGSCGPFPATFEGRHLNLFEQDYQTNVIRLLTIDVTSGQKFTQQSWHVLSPGNDVEFVGIDSGRVYVLAKGNEHTLDVIHALSLTNGADLWSYRVENYTSGSIETPIVAP